MGDLTRDRLTWVALSISVATYQLWPYLPKGSIFVGLAIFYTILAYIIFKQNTNRFVYFLLFCLTINNLLDELFFDPKSNGLNEIAACLLIPIIWLYRKYKIMPDQILKSEIAQFFIKIMIPAFLAVGLKIAVEMKKTKTKITAFNVLLSMLIGVSGAYISSGLVQSYFSTETVPIVIALIAICSDKIGEFVIYKMNIDTFLTALIDGFFDYIIKLRSKK